MVARNLNVKSAEQCLMFLSFYLVICLSMTAPVIILTVDVYVSKHMLPGLLA